MKRVMRSLGLASTFFSLAVSADSVWQGSYDYYLDLSGGVPDQMMFVEYVLEISDNSCRLSIQGYQVFETILCRAEGGVKLLSINFQSYEDGSVKNAYGVQIYKAGEQLFWLDKELITHWDALVPDESVAKPGKYFLKTAQ